MTLATVNAEIAALLANLAANPGNMTPANLNHLATLNGRREALTFMESLSADVRGVAARDALCNLTMNRGNLRGADVTSTMGALAVYGTFAKAV